ncbi:hypothetical protein STTU_0803 [Streptomyces sp. Tu6071]|uniref:hypothetical protein n=1 Tax=Streptomyces sp. Tu6071 TaxID=355249 RepID=UPI00020E5452|nr:hypothetical protein [Streptomyces sp. Tu6071]EGJ73592.1 hypothetical protein STTU_0803 [Streptomyces sp. Tu6071]
MPPAKKTASAPSAPLEAETEDKPTYFDHAGITFEVPAPLDMPLELLLVDDELKAASVIVGEAKWLEYLATRPTIRDFQVFMDKLSEAQGGEDTGN